VARVVYAQAALRDLERLVEFLLDDDPASALETTELVTSAVEMLRKHPILGRVTVEGLRELVISRGKSGYLALYDYHADKDLIIVLGIRQQREAGYSDPSFPD